MLAGISQSLAILVAVVAYYGMDFLLIARYDQDRRAKGSGRSWDFTIMAMSMAAFIIVQPILLPCLGLHVEARWGALLQAVGLLLLIGALALHWWSRAHLQHFYAERVELQPGHVLVDTGPYAYVRHPLFSSFFAFVAGLLLINPALPTLLLALYAVWDLTRAARQEEQLLSRELPGYIEYMACTPRFLPRLSRPPRGDRSWT